MCNIYQSKALEIEITHAGPSTSTEHIRVWFTSQGTTEFKQKILSYQKGKFRKRQSSLQGDVCVGEAEVVGICV